MVLTNPNVVSSPEAIPWWAIAVPIVVATALVIALIIGLYLVSGLVGGTGGEDLIGVVVGGAGGESFEGPACMCIWIWPESGQEMSAHTSSLHCPCVQCGFFKRKRTWTPEEDALTEAEQEAQAEGEGQADGEGEGQADGEAEGQADGEGEGQADGEGKEEAVVAGPGAADTRNNKELV